MVPRILTSDPVLAPIIGTIELEPIEPDPDVYARLLRAIIFQQLSGKAATTIHGRFIQLFPNHYPEAARLVQMKVEELRSVGLSRQKATYVQAVAHFFVEQQLAEANWESYSDEDLITLLTQIKGVGEWTVQMILLGALARPDVWPTKDLAIQQAIQALYQLDARGRKLEQRMIEIAEAWRPHRSLVARYLWNWRDTVV